MPRWHVQIVRLRARDIRVGDVVSKDAERSDGWFRVQEVKNLPDGSVNLLDKGNDRSFTAGPFDLVGLQTPVQLPPEADRSASPPTEGAQPRPSSSDADTSASRNDTNPDAPGTARTPEGAAREAASRASRGDGQSRALPSA